MFKVRKDTKMEICKIISAPTLLYGSETWVPTQEDLNKILSVEMKFLRLFNIR